MMSCETLYADSGWRRHHKQGLSQGLVRPQRSLRKDGKILFSQRSSPITLSRQMRDRRDCRDCVEILSSHARHPGEGKSHANISCLGGSTLDVVPAAIFCWESEVELTSQSHEENRHCMFVSTIHVLPRR